MPISPTFVMEVLSPTEGTLDLQDRLEEYKSLQMLEYILLVGLDDPAVRLWRRDADRHWLYEKSLGPEEVLDLRLVALRLPLATLYAGVSF